MDETTPTDEPEPRGPVAVGVGDLWQVGSVVVAVVAIGDRHVMVHLCHDDERLAYDFDLTATVPGAGGSSATLVAAGELYGPVLRSQLERRIGRLPMGVAEALAAAVWTDAASLAPYRHGPPLGGPGDPRRGHVIGLLGVIDELCAPARQLLPR